MPAQRESSVALIEAGQFLVLERRPNLPGRLRCPGRLSLFGGGMNQGELPHEAMFREMSEEIVTPNGLSDVESLTRVWSGEVLADRVHLFVARLTCGASDVRLHPSLQATGTEIVALPFDMYPTDSQPATMFTWRALVAHSTGDYQNL